VIPFRKRKFHELTKSPPDTSMSKGLLTYLGRATDLTKKC
jgi:hypothetical protein